MELGFAPLLIYLRGPFHGISKLEVPGNLIFSCRVLTCRYFMSIYVLLVISAFFWQTTASEKKKNKSLYKLPSHPAREDLIQIFCLPYWRVYCCCKHQINQLPKKPLKSVHHFISDLGQGTQKRRGSQIAWQPPGLCSESRSWIDHQA